MDFQFGSVKESLAIAAFSRQKTQDFLSSLLAVTDPKQADKAVKELRGVYFPERRHDDLLYLKKAKENFEKLRNIDLRAKPF